MSLCPWPPAQGLATTLGSTKVVWLNKATTWSEKLVLKVVLQPSVLVPDILTILELVFL
jgi:hypothetical protein